MAHVVPYDPKHIKQAYQYECLQVEATVASCSNLPRMEVLGKNADCYVQLDNTAEITPVVKHSLDPQFNHTFFRLANARVLNFSLWDKDKVSKDDLIGHVSISVQDMAERLHAGETGALECSASYPVQVLPELEERKRVPNLPTTINIRLKVSACDRPGRSIEGKQVVATSFAMVAEGTTMEKLTSRFIAALSDNTLVVSKEDDVDSFYKERNLAEYAFCWRDPGALDKFPGQLLLFPAAAIETECYEGGGKALKVDAFTLAWEALEDAVWWANYLADQGVVDVFARARENNRPLPETIRKHHGHESAGLAKKTQSHNIVSDLVGIADHALDKVSNAVHSAIPFGDSMHSPRYDDYQYYLNTLVPLLIGGIEKPPPLPAPGNVSFLPQAPPASTKNIKLEPGSVSYQ